MNFFTKWLNFIASRFMPITTKKRMDWTISLLNIKPKDNILEIGFGPGNCVYQVSQKLTSGKLIGIDESETNYQQAKKFNTYEIEQGKVVLSKASIDKIKEYNNYFDKIYTINSIQFWENRIEGLKIVHNALKTDGIVVITFQSFDNGTKEEDVLSFGESVFKDCKQAGFQISEMKTLKMKPTSAVCIIAKK